MLPHWDELAQLSSKRCTDSWAKSQTLLLWAIKVWSELFPYTAKLTVFDTQNYSKYILATISNQGLVGKILDIKMRDSNSRIGDYADDEIAKAPLRGQCGDWEAVTNPRARKKSRKRWCYFKKNTRVIRENGTPYSPRGTAIWWKLESQKLLHPCAFSLLCRVSGIPSHSLQLVLDFCVSSFPYIG